MRAVVRDGHIEKVCSRCRKRYFGEDLLELKQHFTLDRCTPDGLSFWCKNCRPKGKSGAQRQKVLTEEQLLRSKARTVFRRAVARGKIIRPKKCQSCLRKTSPIQGHHPDYSKPLDVLWVCRPCHESIHRKEFLMAEAKKLANGNRSKHKMSKTYMKRKTKEKCIRGHIMTPENTGIRSGGYGECRICRRAYLRKQRTLRAERHTKIELLKISDATGGE